MSEKDNSREQRSQRSVNQSHMIPERQDLPPLPAAIAGQDAQHCAIIRLYLAVWNDLAVEQQRSIAEHVQACTHCMQEQYVLQHSTRLLQSLPATEPGIQVDRAVQAAIFQHAREAVMRPSQGRSVVGRTGIAWYRRPLFANILVAAIVLIVSLGFGLRALITPAFALPSELSWDKYVLYHKQIATNAQGERYEVMSYHDMQKDMVNIETVIAGKLDVVVVKHSNKSLGLDKMHRVAQWDVNWPMGDAGYSAFNLAQLRRDLAAGRAHYLGKEQFRGQDVYRVQLANGDILLLDMDYMPVNVLAQGRASATPQPMYDSVQWFKPEQVSENLWAMNIPDNFAMGEIPPMP